jgi:tetratricopeptide (TPR) repeat protein
VLVLVLVTASVFSSTADAKPNRKQEASQRFQKGVELYSAGDVRAALIEFRRAYKLMPTYKLLYNMGQAAAELKDYVEAYEYYAQYLDDGRGKLDKERRQEVDATLDQLEGYLATIEIDVSVDDAEVTIDGVVVGISPIDEPILVSAGRRKIVVTRRGHSPWERKLDLAGRDDEVVEVDLISLTADRPPDRDPIVETRYRRNTGRSTAFWTSATVTALVALGTGYSAYRTQETRNRYELELAKVPNEAATIERVGEDLRQLALITDVGLGLTAIGVISTVLLARSSDSASRRRALKIEIGPTQMAIAGHF